MILDTISTDTMPNSTTHGLMSLLHKGGDKTKLTNWHPITLLNVAYKIYAKALQFWLQLVLVNIISLNQSAFLPIRFLLDNILLTHKTKEWSAHSGQLMIFLKLDFSKAYI